MGQTCAGGPWRGAAAGGRCGALGAAVADGAGKGSGAGRGMHRGLLAAKALRLDARVQGQLRCAPTTTPVPQFLHLGNMTRTAKSLGCGRYEQEAAPFSLSRGRPEAERFERCPFLSSVVSLHPPPTPCLSFSGCWGL